MGEATSDLMGHDSNRSPLPVAQFISHAFAAHPSFTQAKETM